MPSSFQRAEVAFRALAADMKLAIDRLDFGRSVSVQSPVLDRNAALLVECAFVNFRDPPASAALEVARIQMADGFVIRLTLSAKEVA